MPEAYASTGITKAARETIGAKSGGRLAEIASANLGDISAKMSLMQPVDQWTSLLCKLLISRCSIEVL